MQSTTLQHAGVLWDYFYSFKSTAPCDALVVCCSYDLRVCDYACELIKQGFSKTIVFSGFQGRWTKVLWSSTEASVFFDRAIKNGVDKNSIILEERATNLAENISFSKLLIPEAKTVTFITKPNTILRVWLTAPIQWPGISFFTSCPDFSFPEDISNIIGLFGVISEMVGDIQRILEYPERGFQNQHELPDPILNSYNYLLKEGFNHHTI